MNMDYSPIYVDCLYIKIFILWINCLTYTFRLHLLHRSLTNRDVLVILVDWKTHAGRSSMNVWKHDRLRLFATVFMDLMKENFWFISRKFIILVYSFIIDCRLVFSMMQYISFSFSFSFDWFWFFGSITWLKNLFFCKGEKQQRGSTCNRIFDQEYLKTKIKNPIRMIQSHPTTMTKSFELPWMIAASWIESSYLLWALLFPNIVLWKSFRYISRRNSQAKLSRITIMHIYTLKIKINKTNQWKNSPTKGKPY